MQDPKDKKAIMADAYSDKRVNELKKATNTPYQMEMASKKLGSMKKKKELPAAPAKKSAMDGLKAVGKYVSTFGLATEKYNPKPKNR